MNKREALILYEYNVWANHHILNAAARVSPDQYAEPVPGLSFGSLRGTLAHILSAEIVWRVRCQEGVSPEALPGEADFPTLGVLLERWQAEEAAMHAHLESLSDEAFGQPVRYRSTKGVDYETPLWQILSHVVNHGTQFRSEAGVVLTRLGFSPGDVDLIYYVRD
ncbi:MAG TPA: DinB family protein [Aggregatilinea sp.]|jgi:uncharacterized damage-inducible protein DinB|uniref:DinB family protein n=1 Tax=Aggregatilinea sp. TaxID=2806333 RepID=UPI002C6EC2F5|nr:DinB family protein [Aggregatilinea sp.]HML23610.1 DinB family protein [Aggregatilinea sp.]